MCVCESVIIKWRLFDSLFRGAFVLSKKLQETLSLSPLRSRDFLPLFLSLDDDVFFDDKLAKN